MKKDGKYCVNPYIGFDDRLLMLIGIPLISFFASLVFSRLTVAEYLENIWYYYPRGIAFTMGYWFWNRTLIIVLRSKIPSLDKTLKRNLLQLTFAFLGYPLVGTVVHHLIGGFCIILGVENLDDKENLVGLLTTYMLTFMILAIYEAVYFFKQYKKAIVDSERMHTQHVNTQLTNLRNQVNPHFLFNSLNTLMSLIPSEAQDAHYYLSKLSSFYRYSVTERDESMVPLSREMEMVGLYSDLIKERFGEGLLMDIDVGYEAGEHVLSMTLQLLVENAVKHNIVSKDDPLNVKVYRANGSIIVENNIQHRITETASTGMGLKNIIERYSYVTENEVRIEQTDGKFKVSVPLIHKKK